jgi:hypothetical protein
MPAPKGENHPYNRLREECWKKADHIKELEKELAETRQTAVFEANLHDMTRKEKEDYRERLAEQCADQRGYERGVRDMTKLLLRCNTERTSMGLSALFG